MKLIQLPQEGIKSQSIEELKNILLDRVLKLRIINKEMNDDASVQRAQNALEIAKIPFKKAKSRWITEIDTIKMELKFRNSGVNFNIHYDEIYEENEEAI